MDKKKFLGKIFVISGPSGVGKTTLLKKLLSKKILGKSLVRSISLTTRPRRPGEREGKDYFFLKEEEFLRLRREKKILEWTRYLGYYYGTPKGIVDKLLAQGENLALCIDVKGGRQIKRFYPDNAVMVFILPPSFKELDARIRARCSLTKESEIQGRLAIAAGELKEKKVYDYRVVNRDLLTATRKLAKIIRDRIKVKQ